MGTTEFTNLGFSEWNWNETAKKKKKIAFREGVYFFLIMSNLWMS